MTRLVCLVLLLAGTVASAHAESVEREARSGRPTSLFVFSLYTEGSCTAGAIPEAKIVQQGQYGRVQIAASKAAVDARNCGNLEVWGQNVVYTSRPGFRGQDTIVVEFAYNPTVEAPRLTSRRYTVTVNVK